MGENEHLHTEKQVKKICDDIIRDYRSGRISYKKAMDRLVEMENLIIPRTKALEAKGASESYVEMSKLKLERMHSQKEGRFMRRR
ncbi:MAG: hypothetical protein M1291_02960 [Thaumarchaeota archaeon]|nr:hypothetical protein [Nitrososphaerota archaeon]